MARHTAKPIHGHYYRLYSGSVIGPLRMYENSYPGRFCHDGLYWNADGSYINNNDLDLKEDLGTDIQIAKKRYGELVIQYTGELIAARKLTGPTTIEAGLQLFEEASDMALKQMGLENNWPPEYRTPTNEDVDRMWEFSGLQDFSSVEIYKGIGVLSQGRLRFVAALTLHETTDEICRFPYARIVK